MLMLMGIIIIDLKSNEMATNIFNQTFDLIRCTLTSEICIQGNEIV